ncbi:acylphosphatase [Catenuloplanes atrovinosus]|uniref:acylphosphatase n=1 Tax=Catenuloplanes atrovinosus TaxID=137266 RepID=A0AAE4C997_9ACTN|nr:acylphosphatase [Catenuloplanes atrovinosus]MDR7274589.1 acylphosphatase [Catenuloplanes atrovinosus]
MERIRVLVSGRVQGVSYRDTCRREAERHGLTGWVRNLPDGRVEAVFEGSPDAVRRMADWCRGGPPHASVTDVTEIAEAPEHLTGFAVAG